MDNKFLDKITNSIKQTPILSPSVSRLLQVSADPEHTLEEMIEIIRSDYALTAQILKVANSVVFNPLQPVTSIDRAVAYLGEIYTIGLALNCGAAAVFNSALTGYEGKRRDLWRHQLYCAIASRLISQHARKKIEADLIFTGGLLHDIGKAILSEHITNTSSEILDGINDGRFADYMDAEEKLFGMNHMDVGFVLAQHWKLPTALQEIIRFHHHPDNAMPEYRAQVFAVHLGDALSMMAGFDTGSDGLKYQLEEETQVYFTLAGPDLEKIQIDAQQEFQRFEDSLDNGEEIHK